MQPETTLESHADPPHSVGLHHEHNYVKIWGVAIVEFTTHEPPSSILELW